MGSGFDKEIHTKCGDVACAPSDPVGRTLNTLMLAAFTAPLEGVALAAKGGGAVAVSQAAGAVAGAVSNPEAPVEGAFVGAAMGTGTGLAGGGPLLTPLKSFVSANVSSVVMTGHGDAKSAQVSLATGTAIGWLDLAARAGSQSPGGSMLRAFAIGMDAFLQVVGAYGTTASTPAPQSCTGEGTCK